MDIVWVGIGGIALVAVSVALMSYYRGQFEADPEGTMLRDLSAFIFIGSWAAIPVLAVILFWTGVVLLEVSGSEQVAHLLAFVRNLGTK